VQSPNTIGTALQIVSARARLPCGLYLIALAGIAGILCALTSLADMGTRSFGDWYIRSLPDRDEDSSESSGNDYVG